MDKENKKALVTGATGFTGTALCERLVRDGYEVFAFVRASSKYEHLAKIGVHCIENDITDKESVEQTFPAVDVVFHIAAAYRSEHADHKEFQKVNVGATKVLLIAES